MTENAVSHNVQTTENAISLSPQNILDRDYELVPAYEYYDLVFKDRFGKTKFYYEYIRGHRIPVKHKVRSGKGGRGRSGYYILVDNPEIIEKVRMRQKASEIIKNYKKSFVIKIPSRMEVEFENTISSPLAHLYKEFFDFLKSEKTKTMIKAGKEKYVRRRVEIFNDHHEIISEYAEELNMKVPEIIPILIRLFFENRE